MPGHAKPPARERHALGGQPVKRSIPPSLCGFGVGRSGVPARSDHPFGANGAGPGRDQDCGFAAFRPSDGAPVDVAPSGVRVVEQDDDGMVGFFVVLWRAGRVSHQSMRPTRRIGIGKAGPRWPPRSRQGRQPPAGGHDRPLRYLPSWSCRFHSRRPLSSLRRKSERRLAAVRDRTKAARRSYPSGR